MIASFIKKLITSTSTAKSSSTPSSSLHDNSTSVPLVQHKTEDNDRGYYLSHPPTDWVEYEGNIKLEEEVIITIGIAAIIITIIITIIAIIIIIIIMIELLSISIHVMASWYDDRSK